MSQPDEAGIRALQEKIATLEQQARDSRRVQTRLAVRDAITRALAESASLAQAAPCVLEAIGETLEWQTGALWLVEPHLDVMRCVEFWHAPGLDVTAFEAATRRAAYGRGMGLPGLVWERRQSVWIPDFSGAASLSNAPRAAVVAEYGLRAALAFPIQLGDDLLGVLEFFSREIKEPDADLAEMFRAVGSQIGQFAERKKAEDLLNRFFMLSVDMFAIAGFDGYYKLVNPAWERTLGYTPAEMGSKPFLEFVHPEDRDATVAEVAKLSSGGDTISFENRYLAKDGSWRWMLCNATPVMQHQVIYASARDVTERKSDEANITRLREEAEEANRAKSEFLARMSHEIRTPLNVIIGMGDLLDRTPLTAEQRQYVRIFQRAGSTLLALINDILDLAKVESGRMTLEELEFEVAGALESSAEMLSEQAKAKGLTLRVEIGAGTPRRVKGDPDRLRQVLINLVSNAVKFTTRGRVTIRVEPEGENDLLRFSVADTGIGIPPDKLEMIFDAFTQADASTTRQYGGTGLGLAICKRLVDLLGGRIWVESTPGAGATFTFTANLPDAGEGLLPHLAPVSEPVAVPHAPQEAAQPGTRILVVDDSDENRFLVAEYLRDTRAHLEFAADGAEAFEKFQASLFDLVFMDLQMPIMDGYEATRRIRAWEQEQQRQPTPVIALTASAMESELHRSLEAGCTAYLRKPVRLATLLDAVHRYAPPAERIVVRPDARLRQVIPAYLKNRRRDLDKIAAALDHGDYAAIRDIGHKMSGTGGGYGFPQVTRIGRCLETAAKQKNAARIRLHLTELQRFLEQVEIGEDAPPTSNT